MSAINHSFENLTLPEEKKTVGVVSSLNNETLTNTLFSRFSSWPRLKRTISWCFRFAFNLKAPSKRSGALTVDELRYSTSFIVKALQHDTFKQTILELQTGKTVTNKALLSLSVFLDDYQLLRVGGRLKNANIQFEQKHPLLLPSKNHVTHLILEHEHIRLGHAGAQTVLSNIRLQFWPLDGLREIKRIIRNCNSCFRFCVRSSEQIMSDLPKERVCVTSRAFENIGLDFAGPFFIKSSRLRKASLQKCYAAIFICMTTKAIHIEVVSDLSTQAFLASFKRFTARRGNSIIIYSDNATNFVGARNYLSDLRRFFSDRINSNTVEDFCSSLNIQWKFIPPRSPHFGGLWESAVKGAKIHLTRIVGRANLTFEELNTVFCQIEGIMNSRPLCPMSNDPTDLDYLTPGHFLIGTNLTAYPEKSILDQKENRLSVWQRCTQMQQQFWRRWSVEYLNRLQNKPKWLKTFENLKINELVFLKEDNVSPLCWPRGRVIEVFPGKDGRIRVVKLKTQHGIFTRPITKLCRLPIQDLN